MTDYNIGVIILAAGNSNRMLPIKINKPLIKIDGSNTNIMDISIKLSNILGKNTNVTTIIPAFAAAEDYKNIFPVIKNEYSKITNNITSLIKFYNSDRYINTLDGYIILEADNIYDEKELSKIVKYISNNLNQSLCFTRIRSEGEWVPVLNSSGHIEDYRLSKTGEYSMGGVSYITIKDFSYMIESFLNGNKTTFNDYWEIALFNSLTVQIPKEADYEKALAEKAALEYRLENDEGFIVEASTIYEDVIRFNNKIINAKQFSDSFWIGWFYNDKIATIDLIEFKQKE